MEGILCIDKPPEHTSFDVVARMRGIAKTRKIGHGGTLDPMATGVLPLFFGRAAKACDLLPSQDKAYTATFRLGLTTDTQDITGTVLSRQAVDADRARVEAALAAFVGPQKQVPPMYSAVKIGGKRLYDLARQGIQVERAARDIVIRGIRLVGCGTDEYTIEVDCSKGTYIRTLCHDVGQVLGCGAVLTALRRTAACGFALDQCITLEEAAARMAQGTLEQALLPVAAAFAALPRLELTVKQARHLCNGVAMSLGQFASPVEGLTALYREDGVFLGLGEPDPDGTRLKLKKLFYLGGPA